MAVPNTLLVLAMTGVDATLVLLVGILLTDFPSQVSGTTLHVQEGYRSQAVQDAYWAQGREILSEVNALRKKAGLAPIGNAENANLVTWTRRSKHNMKPARAVDLVIHCMGVKTWNPQIDCDRDGVPDYRELGWMAEELGLRWGGRWGDPGHVELE